MANPIEDGIALFDAIVRYQKQKKSQPFVTELQRVGSQWSGANPTQRQNLNTQANAIRNAYLQAGGSPIDIDRAYWGSDSNAGFQTGQKQFTPGYFGDNLSRGQKMRDAGLTGMYERKPTWNREVETAGLTGLFQGRPTMQKQIFDFQRENTLADNQRQLQNMLDESARGWAGLGLQTQKLQQSMFNLPKIKKDAYSYFDKLPTNPKYNSYNNQIAPGVGLKTKAAMKNQFSTWLDGYLQQPDPYAAFQQDKNKILADMPDSGPHLVNALENALSQAGKW